MSAPLKPWERAGVNSQSSAAVGGGLQNQMSSFPVGDAPSGATPGLPVHAVNRPPPPVPARVGQQTSSFGYNSGLSGYGGGYGYGGYSSYGGAFSSPMGGMYGNSMYGGYGGYGGGYGMNRYGGYDNGPPSSFVRMAEESSRQAFGSIESIVHAFGSISMMLESTFQAVYNSFRAVIGVADHFSRMKTHFAQIFSAFAVIRTLKWLYRRLLVLLRLRQSGVDEEVWSAAVSDTFTKASEASGGNRSSWPIMFFFAVIIGGPWLIWKFLSSVASVSRGEGWASGEQDHFVAQAEFDFEGDSTDELSFRAGQRINVAPKEIQPRMKGWLLASVDGQKTGIIPANYVKILGKRRGRKSPAQNNSATRVESPTGPRMDEAFVDKPRQSSSINLNNSAMLDEASNDAFSSPMQPNYYPDIFNNISGDRRQMRTAASGVNPSDKEAPDLLDD